MTRLTGTNILNPDIVCVFGGDDGFSQTARVRNAKDWGLSEVCDSDVGVLGWWWGLPRMHDALDGGSDVYSVRAFNA